MGFVDPNDFEAVALDTASKLGGAYVGSEGMNRIIPNEWQPEQWRTLVETICAAYVSSLQDQADMIRRTLEKIQPMPIPGIGQNIPVLNSEKQAELDSLAAKS